MKKKLDRRMMLQTLGAGAVAATTGCDPSPYRMNLICHGMLLFFYDRSDGMKDYITILIPVPPMVHKPDGTTGPGHAIVLSETQGTSNNRLKPQVQPLGDNYALEVGAQFTRNVSKFYPKPGKGPSGTDRIVMHNEKYNLRRGQCAYAIKVPYPTNVYSYKLVDFQTSDDRPDFGGVSPYDPSTDCARYFELNDKLRSMAGVHVFSYERVTEAVKLNDDSGNVCTFKDSGGPLNLHLYSQAASRCDHSMDHIGAFNKVLNYQDASKEGAQWKDLDLAVAKGLKLEITYCEPTAIEGDLRDGDLADLTELPVAGGQPEKCASGDSSTALVDNRTYTVVDCLQAWGT